jgi:hypothetical protein
MMRPQTGRQVAVNLGDPTARRQAAPDETVLEALRLSRALIPKEKGLPMAPRTAVRPGMGNLLAMAAPPPGRTERLRTLVQVAPEVTVPGRMARPRRAVMQSRFQRMLATEVAPGLTERRRAVPDRTARRKRTKTGDRLRMVAVPGLVTLRTVVTGRTVGRRLSGMRTRPQRRDQTHPGVATVFRRPRRQAAMAGPTDLARVRHRGATAHPNSYRPKRHLATSRHSPTDRIPRFRQKMSGGCASLEPGTVPSEGL